MKIGIFDSGLGGLIVARAIRRALPRYDYVYLGDTQRVPYGNRSAQTVYKFTKECAEYLFEKENCGLVILACNTASARALKKLQKEFTPSASGTSPYGRGRKGRGKILGVLIPAAEEAAKFKRVGVIGTAGTIASKSFPKEIKKILARRSFSEGGNKTARVFQNPAPMLVPLAEAGESENAKVFIQNYLAPFKNEKIQALVLGCTHYPIFRRELESVLRSFSVGGKKVQVISQDEIVPKKLKSYLAWHPEIAKKLSRNRTVKILVTDETETIDKLVRKWFGNVKPRLITL